MIQIRGQRRVSRRALIVISAGAALALAIGVGAALRLSDDAPAAGTGDLIAYSCREPKNPWYAICVAPADGTDSTQLTHDVATTYPAWSPDGRRIAYTRHEDVDEYLQSTQDDIFVMDADGGGARQITPDRAGQSSFRPTWSPDGERIAFLRSDDVAINNPTRYGDLVVIGVDGTGENQLTKGRLVSGPAWSPDGHAIAMSIGRRGTGVPTVPDSDIYVLDLERGALRQVTNTPGLYESAPAWSPDGTRLAFARWTLQTQFDGKGAVYVVNRDGSDERPVLKPRHFASGPYSLAWSPDGRALALETSSMIGCVSISTVDVRSHRVRPMTSCRKPVESTMSPTWQPSPAP